MMTITFSQKPSYLRLVQLGGVRSSWISVGLQPDRYDYKADRS